MVNAIKLSENEANEIIAKYLRTISNIVDAKLNSNMYGYTITDTLDCHGKSFKRLREIKLLDYMSLLKLSLKSEGHNVDMIKQVSEKNENNEYEKNFKIIAEIDEINNLDYSLLDNIKKSTGLLDIFAM